MELVDLLMASRLSGAAYTAASPSVTVWILLCGAEARANAQRLNLTLAKLPGHGTRTSKRLRVASTGVVYDRQRPTCSSSGAPSGYAEPVRAAFRSKVCEG